MITAFISEIPVWLWIGLLPVMAACIAMLVTQQQIRDGAIILIAIILFVIMLGLLRDVL
ncbi:hypothetical protein GN156_39215, partial [bacterium LRH843]|nr:hypothetical protein [bacterium LRH843]